MVRTRARGACPPILNSNQPSWTKRWRRILNGHAKGDWATPKAKKAIKEAVTQLTHGKCVFCEKRLGGTAYPGIEHYHPKSLYLDQAFEWSNLFPVCEMCNDSKGPQDHQGVLLKADEEDPELFLTVHPDTGRLEPVAGLSAENEARAKETIRLCSLERPVLEAERAKLIEQLARWNARVQISPEDPYLAEELREFLDPRIEYKLVLRSFFDQRNYALLADLDRRLFQE